eukprot:Nk52_evm120s151 gene=Nk52_evmTU120s151
MDVSNKRKLEEGEGEAEEEKGESQGGATAEEEEEEKVTVVVPSSPSGAASSRSAEGARRRNHNSNKPRERLLNSEKKQWICDEEIGGEIKGKEVLGWGEEEENGKEGEEELDGGKYLEAFANQAHPEYMGSQAEMDEIERRMVHECEPWWSNGFVQKPAVQNKWFPVCQQPWEIFPEKLEEEEEGKLRDENEGERGASMAGSSGKKRVSASSSTSSASSPPSSSSSPSCSSGCWPWFRKEVKNCARGVTRLAQRLLAWPGPGGIASMQKSGRKVSYTEILVDLVFVVGIDVLSTNLKSGEEGSSIQNYLFKFCALFFFWLGYVLYSNWVYTDDVVDRIHTLLYMFGVAGLVMYIRDTFTSPTFGKFSAAAAVIKLILTLGYSAVSYYDPGFRATGVFMGGLNAGQGILWLCGALAANPEALAIVALILEPLGFVVFFLTFPRKMRPALNLELVIERFDTFFIIVLGDVVANVSKHSVGQSNEIQVAMFLGFLLVFSYKLLMFDARHVHLYEHTLRYSSLLGVCWVISYCPMLCGMALSGTGMALIFENEIYKEDPEDATKNNTEGEIRRFTNSDLRRGLVCFGAFSVLITLTIHRLLHRRKPLCEKINPSEFIVETGCYRQCLKYRNHLGGCLYTVDEVSKWNREQDLKYEEMAYKAVFWIQTGIMAIVSFILLIPYFRDEDGLSDVGLIVYVSVFLFAMVAINLAQEGLKNRIKSRIVRRRRLKEYQQKEEMKRRKLRAANAEETGTNGVESRSAEISEENELHVQDANIVNINMGKTHTD